MIIEINDEKFKILDTLLDGYLEYPLIKKFLYSDEKGEEFHIHRWRCVDEIFLMIRDVQLGFVGTYEEWLDLEYDENDLPIIG